MCSTLRSTLAGCARTPRRERRKRAVTEFRRGSRSSPTSTSRPYRGTTRPSRDQHETRRCAKASFETIVHKAMAENGQTRYQRDCELTQALQAMKRHALCCGTRRRFMFPLVIALHDPTRGRRERHCGPRHGHHGPQGSVWHSAFRDKPKPLETVAAADSPRRRTASNTDLASSRRRPRRAAGASSVDCGSFTSTSRSVRGKQTPRRSRRVWIVHPRVRVGRSHHDPHQGRARFDRRRATARQCSADDARYGKQLECLTKYAEVVDRRHRRSRQPAQPSCSLSLP